MIHRPLLPLLALLLALPCSAGAQSTADQRIRQHADSLAKIRQERERLQEEMRRMQSTVRNIGEEVQNISQQSAATARLVRTLDSQLDAINAEVENSSASLVRAQDELAIKRADLRRRVSDIYRKGPLHTLEVLFSARSITDLIARYKYLHLQTVRDRAMLSRVQQLRDDIESTRAMRVRLQMDIGQTLAEREQEQQRLRALEQQRRTALNQAQSSAVAAERRLTQIAEAEKQLNDLIANLNREARAATGNRGLPSGPSVFTAGAALDWPVSGEVLYRFGIATSANNTQVKWNGIGISAPRGTGVRAVANGRVEYAAELDGYGRAIVIVHASGDYTVYGSLDRISVSPGTIVNRSDIIGTVGTSNTAIGAHLHFEVRLNSPGAQPRAVDPLPYLKPRGP